MRKENVIEIISQNTGMDKKTVSDIIESFFVVVKDSMAEGNNIYLRGFGTFLNKKKAQKVGRNISQNTPLIIEEHFAPKFKPSDKFIEKVKNSSVFNNKS